MAPPEGKEIACPPEGSDIRKGRPRRTAQIKSLPMPHRALSVLENLPDQSILQRIGNTPLIRIRLLEKEFPHITFYAKAEWFNPGGSVKDRPALRMIEEAEKTGELTVEKVILDSTSGNTGIAYALIGAAKGYQVKLVMPANVNEERREIVKAFGAAEIVTPALEESDGAIREPPRIKESSPGVGLTPARNNNPSNWRALRACGRAARGAGASRRRGRAAAATRKASS